jgi:hypothetical protein
VLHQKRRVPSVDMNCQHSHLYLGKVRSVAAPPPGSSFALQTLVGQIRLTGEAVSEHATELEAQQDLRSENEHSSFVQGGPD